MKKEKCPFCGDDAELIKDEINGYKGNYFYSYSCSNEDCPVKPETQKHNDIYCSAEEAKSKAFKDWNNRVNNGVDITQQDLYNFIKDFNETLLELKRMTSGGYNPSSIIQDRGDGKIYSPLNKGEIKHDTL